MSNHKLCFIFVSFLTIVSLCTGQATKPGSCPNATGMIGVCLTLCSSDSTCTGAQKCCSNGCGKSCLDPVDTTVKAGACPVTSSDSVGLCVEECSGDSFCSGAEKCCPNGCGHSCQNPVIVNKPGTCPSPLGTIGTCVYACNDDSTCTGSQKCCSNGCGAICQDPVPVVKAGVCPSSSGGIGLCVESCSGDATCPANQKCCSNGCGQSCQSPLFPCDSVQCSNGTVCAVTSGIATCTTCNTVNCLMEPCAGQTCNGYPNATCTANYCGGCNAVWTNNGIPVTCAPPTPVCNCSALPPLAAPAVMCADGTPAQLKCNTTTCAWELQPCPLSPSQSSCSSCSTLKVDCFSSGAGIQSVGSSSSVPTGNVTLCGTTVCKNLNGICVGYLSCNNCPAPPAPQCEVSGCNMDQCVPAGSPVFTICQINANPSLSCTRFSSCIYNTTTSSCGWQNSVGYQNCLNNVSVDPCKTRDPCICGANPQCGFCQTNLTLVGNSSVTVGFCMHADVAATKCLSPKTALGFGGNFLPAVVCPYRAMSIPSLGQSLSQKANTVDEGEVQLVLNELVSKDAVTSQFSVTLDSIVDASTLSPTQSLIRNIVTVTGTAVPTPAQEQAVCDVLAQALVLNVGGTNSITECTLARISAQDQAVLKRSASQSVVTTSYFGNVTIASNVTESQSSATGSPPASAQGWIVAVIVVAVVLVVVLVVAVALFVTGAKNRKIGLIE